MPARQRIRTKAWRSKGGHRKIRLYRVWGAMHRRCTNPAQNRYEHYGGRGISVCDEWSTFEPFRKWMIANGYGKGLQIDRIDNDLGYSPDNCRLVTNQENALNRRKPEEGGRVYASGKDHPMYVDGRRCNAKVDRKTAAAEGG